MNKSIMTLEKVIFNATNQGLMIVDKNFTVIDINQWLIDAIDNNKAHLVGRSIFDLFSFERPQFLRSTIKQAFECGLSSFLSSALHPRLFPLLSRYQSGDRYMEQSCYIKRIFFNDETYCLIQILDVTSNVMRERLLNKTSNDLSLFKIAIEHSASSIVIADNDGQIQYVNPRFVEIAGFTSEDAIGHSYFSLSSQAHEQQFEATVKSALHFHDSWKGERSFVTKSGDKYWVNEHIYQARNANNEPTHLVAIQDDLTQIRDIARKASYQASHDSLTGLVNRDEFDKILIQEITRCDGNANHVLCFLDIDQFKVVNDTSGHGAGDELLRQIANLFDEYYPNDKVLARLGGDEFAVILHDSTFEQAQKISEALIQQVQAFRFRWDDSVFTVGMSVGLTLITAQTVSSVEAIKQAENACDVAKDMGRNRVYIYQDDDDTITQRQGDTYWANKINDALENDRFLLYAQPIVPLLDDSKSSFEVLVRMDGYDGHIIPPGLFLPAGERYNLSHHIDRWVINNTVAWLVKHRNEVAHIDHISINLSGLTLSNDSFLAHIVKVIKDNDIEASKISFEITETAAIANITQAKHFISVLRKLGCLFALDDFGSGLSSFAYLKNLKVDRLKIDGMFVKDITVDAIDEAMVKSINDIGHVMGMKTIAEFVEDDAIKMRLIELGIDYGQGYGLGKPVPIDRILSHSTEIV